VALIKEINELRREIKSLKNGAKELKDGSARVSKAGATEGDKSNREREIEMQRDLIQRLRNELLHCNQRIKELEDHVSKRPVSRERLPPMEGMEPVLPKPPSRESQRMSISREGKPPIPSSADPFPPGPLSQPVGEESPAGARTPLSERALSRELTPQTGSRGSYTGEEATDESPGSPTPA
jgi:hypothetical protein